MQRERDLLDFIPLLTLLTVSVAWALVAFFLAKEKGRNVVLWTILGAIPLLNIACTWFFIGAANLRFERKLDELLSRLPAKV
jgi:amino acid permease